MMIWTFHDPRMTMGHLGLIPYFLSEDDLRPARVQFNERYISGWRHFDGFKLLASDTILYPGDPPMRPLAETKLRDERILFYNYAWVMVMQPDRSFEICRMD